MQNKAQKVLLSLAFAALFLSFTAQATTPAASPVQAAGSESPAAVADKEAPVQQNHLQPTDGDLVKIKKCAMDKGVADITKKDLTEQQQKTVDQCYRDNGVVAPSDLKSYEGMKGQYY